MSITEHQSTYETYARQLVLAIEHGNDDEISRVDLLLESEFQRILELDPVDDEARVQQARFLLERLIPGDERSRTQTQICDKLLNLVHAH